MNFRIAMMAGATVFALMSVSAPDCRATGQAATGSESAVAQLLRLLEAKGVLTGGEAQELRKKFDREPVGMADGSRKKAANLFAAPPAEGGVAGNPPKAPYAHEEVVSTIDALTEQGIFDQEEGKELRERANRLNSLAEGEKVEERPNKEIGASEIPYRRTTLTVDDISDQLRFLAYQQVVTRDEAVAANERFGRKQPTDQFAADITAEVKNSIQNQMDQKTATISGLEKTVGKLPEWLNRFRLYGDLRLRYQGDYFDQANAYPLYRIDKPSEQLNTTEDRQRFRIRARLGILAKITDQVEAALGLATGSTSDPVSTNLTLGDGFNKKTITLDTAYLKWTPVKGLTAWGGRIPNPWFSTDLVWDRDLNFDGFAVSYAPALTDKLGLFLTAGAFPLQEVELSGKDKWLFGGQLGLSYQPIETVGAKLGVAYYRFENTQGRLYNTLNEIVNGTYNYTAPPYVQKGNTYFDIYRNFYGMGYSEKYAQAAKYHELNITGSIDLGFWHPIHLVLMGDFVMNLGYDSAEVNSLTGNIYPKENLGYQVGLAVGHPQFTQFGDWRTYFNYRYLEADAVMDAYTDSDFHLGGTNAKGWTVGAEFGLAKNIWLSGKWMSASEISGEKMDIDVFQLDLNAKF